MKKFIYILVMALMPFTMFAKNNKTDLASAITEGVTTIHEDINTAYNDGKTAIGTVYEDSKGIISTVYIDGKEFLKDAYPEVKEAIVSIAHSLGVAAEHVYGVLVKKYFTDGLTELGIFLAGIILLIVGWVKLDRYIKSKQAIDWHIIYPLTIAIVGGVILGNVHYHEMVINLFNPEWGAINYILDVSKTLIK